MLQIEEKSLFCHSLMLCLLGIMMVPMCSPALNRLFQLNFCFHQWLFCLLCSKVDNMVYLLVIGRMIYTRHINTHRKFLQTANVLFLKNKQKVFIVICSLQKQVIWHFFIIYFFCLWIFLITRSIILCNLYKSLFIDQSYLKKNS